MNFIAAKSFLISRTNRLRPRVRAIQKTRPIAYRAKVLGQALLTARANANSLWMFLSGNAEVSFPPTISITAAAVSLPITTANNADDSAAATGSASAANVDSPGLVKSVRRILNR
jgi:uncharacterized protein YggE